MVNKQLDIEFNYTLTPEWQMQVVKNFGATLIKNKVLVFPPSVASGYSLFLEIFPGLSLSLLDFVCHRSINFVRQPVEENYYIIYYDMNDINTNHFVGEEINKTGLHAKQGMALIDSQIMSKITPPVGIRSLYLRLIIDKIFFKSFAIEGQSSQFTESILNSSAESPYFYRRIDSKSKLLLNEIKAKDSNNPVFEILLRGASAHLLYYLLRGFLWHKPKYYKYSKLDIENILSTSNYLKTYLMSEFPGLSYLAKMARMSVTKYSILFREIIGTSPKSFFLVEKLKLGDKLLRGGVYCKVSEVAYSLGYSDANYFSSKFRQFMGVSPKSRLIKRES